MLMWMLHRYLTTTIISYAQLCIKDYVLNYVAGYVARKGSRFTKFFENKQAMVCDICLKTLVLGPNDTG